MPVDQDSQPVPVSRESQVPLTIQFSSPWNVRRPFVYRHLEKRWVDRFFKTGELRISSFGAFALHNDEERKDVLEGQGSVYASDPDTGQSVFIAAKQGVSAYVLCGSSFLDMKLQNQFGTDSGFRIDDTIHFAQAISACVPAFRGGVEGPCVYVEERQTAKNTE